MPIRLTGLTSGLDTEMIVKELVSAYSKKSEKYTKEQTKLSWKQDAWKDLNTKIYSLYTSVSNLRFSSGYVTKKATSSDASKATVSVESTAPNGTQKLNVLSTAQAGYMTGGKIQPKELDENTKLSALGYNGDGKFYVNVPQLVDDGAGNMIPQLVDDGTGNMIPQTVTKEINVDALGGATIKDVLDQLNASDSGVTASFVDGKFQISGKDGGTFSLSSTNGSGVNAENLRALQALGLRATNQESSITGGELNFRSTASLDDGKVTSETTLGQLGFNHGIGVAFQVKTKDDKGEEQITKIQVNSNTSIDDVLKELKEAGLNANFDEKQGRFYISSRTTGKDGDFTIEPLSDLDGANREKAVEALELLGLKVGDGDSGAKKIAGKDAEIILNGVHYQSKNNDFDINGVRISAQGVTGEGDENAISINVSTDNQAIYDKVKNFLTQYNNIINEMTKLYNAESSKGYEPLTDDEKDAMSDTEIEKWESKIKKALLRRDTTLDGVMSVMINSMSKAYEINGKKYALSSFGIHTLGFLNAAENEQNAFRIDGDEDDSNTSGNEEKLMKAINEDPDTVVEFMKQLASGLYTAIDGKMKSTSMSSAYKVYNDKEMDRQYDNYKKTIAEWDKKVTAKEDYYYKKFTAMEKAMASLQNSTSTITGLFQ